MLDLIVAFIGAAAGLTALHFFDKYNNNKQQKKLEAEVVKIKEKQARLEGEQVQEDKETNRKADDIEKEKNNKPSGSSLSDWFNRRK